MGNAEVQPVVEMVKNYDLMVAREKNSGCHQVKESRTRSLKTTNVDTKCNANPIFVDIKQYILKCWINQVTLPSLEPLMWLKIPSRHVQTMVVASS